MLKTKVFRSFLALALACVMSLSLFIPPAFASNPSAPDSFMHGFWEGLGFFLGGTTGAVVLCYTVDVAIAPVAPPVAAYLATVCPVAGGVSGAAAGFALVK
jgi:hypothetical protein